MTSTTHQQLSSSVWLRLTAAWAEVGMASLFVNAGQLLLPLFSMLVYDKVVSNGVFETLWALTIGMLLYISLDVAMRWVRAWTMERIAADLAKQSDEALWQKLLLQVGAPPSGFAGFLAQYRDMAGARDFVSSSYLLSIADLPFFVLYLLAIAVVAWPLAVVLLILALFYSAAGLLLQRKATALGKTVEQIGTRKLTYMNEVLSALDVLQTSPKLDAVTGGWLVLSYTTAELEAKRRLVASYISTLAAGMMPLTTVVLLVTGAYLIEARELSVGGLIASSLLASRSMALVASLFTVVGKWQDFLRTTQRVEDSLKQPVEHHYTDKAVATGQFDVLNLSKIYPERPTVLDNISLHVKAGERIALLGKPGSGKTTLLQAIAGLTAIDQGQILFDGLALTDISRDDKCQWLAYKGQEPALFAGSLAENLLISGSTLDSERMRLGLWASGLEDEFKSGRLSLGMRIAENGRNLSGGQRQKIALARVFAQPARILLLDEPTLGLDADGERLLAERLPKVVEHGVLIISTHSSVLLGLTPRIIALDAGKIVADGLRDQLVRTQ